MLTIHCKGAEIMDIKAPKLKCGKASPFKIKAKTAAEAIKALDANGCWGQHDWDVKWDWSDENNVVTEVVLKPTCSITMPEWPGAKDLDADKKKEWDAAMKALKKHEEEHHSKFAKWYDGLPKGLKKLGKVPGKKVDDFMKKALDEHDKLQKKYDKDSKNGAKEGVNFSA